MTAFVGLAGVLAYLAGWLGAYVFLVGVPDDAAVVSGGRLSLEEVGAVGAGLLTAGLVAVSFALRRVNLSGVGGAFAALHALTAAALGAFAVYSAFASVMSVLRRVIGAYQPWRDAVLIEAPDAATFVLVPAVYVFVTWVLGCPLLGRSKRSLGHVFFDVLGVLFWVLPPGLVGVFGVLGYWLFGMILLAPDMDVGGSARLTLAAFVLSFLGVVYPMAAGREDAFSGLFGVLHGLTFAAFYVFLVIAAVSLAVPFVLSLRVSGPFGMFRGEGAYFLYLLLVPGLYVGVTKALTA
jgi:hypothetical protein